MNQENDTLALINSKISNVGIYLLISLILLLVSRFFRGSDNEMYNRCFVLFSICYFLLTILITNFSLSDICSMYNSLNIKNKSKVRKWLFIFRFILFFNLVFVGFITYILYKKYYDI